MYIQRNIKSCLRNYCCSAKATSIPCFCVCVCVCVCVFCVNVDARAEACACARVTVIVQHAAHRHIFICGLSGSYVFFDIIYKRHDLQKEATERDICVLIFSTTFIWNISHSKKNPARYFHKRRNVFMYSTPYFCRVLMKLECFVHITKKISNIKFHQNPSSGSQVVPCGQRDKRNLRT
jgi:hypothetical protein